MANGKSGIHHVGTGKLLASRFKVLEKIGQGGMGEVYLGWDSRTKKHVAIKVLNETLAVDPYIVQRFRNEVALINRVGHDGIASVLDCSQEGEQPIFIVFEYLDGPTLGQVLGDPPVPLHPQRIRRIGLQILDVLSAVHENNIVHRDLKPENVFVLQRGGRQADTVKIIDFGIAIFAMGGGRLTKYGTVVGTPLYMSPEQCRGLPTVDHRADLYAFGVMLYEMATGRLPFEGSTMDEVQTAHISKPVPSPNQFNLELFSRFPKLETIILRALRKNPEDRFQTASELYDALDEAIPGDRSFYHSQRASPVNGRALSALSPVGIKPVKGPRRPLSPTESAETRRLSTSGDDITTARTFTPSRFGKSISLRGKRPRFDTILARLRRAKARLGEIPRLTRYVVLGGLVLGAALAILIPLFSSSDEKKQEIKVTAVSPDAKTLNAETSSPDAADVREVVITQVPVIVPEATKPEVLKSEVMETEQQDATVPEATPEIPAAPPNYDELLKAGRLAASRGNYRLAIAKLKEAALLWREGEEAWDTLMEIGKVMVAQGKFRMAKDLYNWCLEPGHLPDNDIVRRSMLASRLRVLESRQ